MNDQPLACPQCGSGEIHHRKSRGDWTCDVCLHCWAPCEAAGDTSEASVEPKARIFLSYGRRDAEDIADRLEADLALLGFEVWRDRRQIRSGKEWDNEIEVGLRSSQLVVALLSPHAVREESVCRDEIGFAKHACKVPIVPVMVQPCEAPFVIFRLDYIDLCAWRDSADQYKQGVRRLVDAITAALRGEPPRYRRWDDRFRPFDFASFLHDRRRDFCGRTWLFDEIEAWRTDPTRPRALLITGDPGIGKSAILAQLVHLNPGGQVLAYHCCRADTPETLRSARFVRSLAAMIASQLEGFANLLEDPRVAEALSEARCESDPASAFEEGILNPLHRLHTPPGGDRYILIDALDEALTVGEGLSLVNLLSPSRLDRLPDWLRVVATTRKEPDVLDRLRGLRAEEIVAQDPRNLDDIERFLAHRLGQPALASRLFPSVPSALAREGRPSVPSPLAGEGQGEGSETSAAWAAQTSDIVRRLREKSDGNFLWVKQALLGIERGDFRFDRLDELPPGLTGLYRSFFERHFPDDASYAPARAVLQVVVAAAEPLAADQLAAASGLDPDYELPRILGQLAAYLPERDGLYAAYHKSLIDWLTAPESFHRVRRNFAASPRCGHRRLADWCWAGYQRGPVRMSPYALAHLPAHLIESARWDDLAALLFDLSYLEAKAESGHVFDLAMNFTRSVERMPEAHPARRRLRLINQALRFDLHFLARHPTTLFQCLWNRCWWYDCPEAAAHYDPPASGWPAKGPPWSRLPSDRLSTLLEHWRAARKRRTPGAIWLRSLRPPSPTLGSPQLACLGGHEDGVLCVEFSPDGSRIASVGEDTVRIWDAASGVELLCLQGRSPLRSAAYSPDGGRLAVRSCGGAVYLHDPQSGIELATLWGTMGFVTCMAFSPDGRRLACGSIHSRVGIWDAASDGHAELTCLRLAGNEGEDAERCSVECVAYSPDGRCLAIGLRDCTVRVLDLASGAEVASLRGHERSVLSVTYSPDGCRIASGSDDATVRIWDAASGAQLACLRGHETTILSVAYSRDGRCLASASRDNTARIWDAASGAPLACLEGHGSAVWSVMYSPDRRCLATGSEDCTVRVWDAIGATQLHDPPCREPRASVNCLAFSPDGRCLASGSEDAAVVIWDVATGAELARLDGHESAVRSVSYSPDGRRIGTGSRDGVRVWDAATRAQIACIDSFDVPFLPSFFKCIAYSPDGRCLAYGSCDNTVRIWEAASGAQLACLVGYEKVVLSVAFSPDGRCLASHLGDKVRICDAATGAELACLSGHESAVTCLAYSPDGRCLASGSEDSTVRIWDTLSGLEQYCLRGHEKTVQSVAFSPDGRRLGSGSWDRTVRVWDTATGNQTLCFKGHEALVSSVMYSPNGRCLASGSGDDTVRIWDAATGAELICLRGHGRAAWTVAYSPDGRRLASGSNDSMVRIRDAASGAEIACLRGHEDVVTCVAFSPDGHRLASGSWDHSVRVWDVATGACLKITKVPDDFEVQEGDARWSYRQWLRRFASSNDDSAPNDRETELQFRSERGLLENVIERTADGQPIAWFPGAVRNIVTHPSGRIWAGSMANHLYIIQLEGELAPKPSLQDAP
jgi:WD40 repeat protein